jgi:hypothetical protein
MKVAMSTGLKSLEGRVSDDSVYRVSEGGLLQLRSGVRRWGGRSVWGHKHKLSTRKAETREGARTYVG